jgi:hypothetical protein
VKTFLATESTNPDSGYEPSKSSSDDEEEIVESREEEVVESGEDSFVEFPHIEQKARAANGLLRRPQNTKKKECEAREGKKSQI